MNSNKNKTKSNRNKGFTLVETLVCLVCVTLVTMLLVVMTDTAKNTYVKLEKNAGGQILCSVLSTSIQDELRFTKYVAQQSGSSSVPVQPFSDGKVYTCYPFVYDSQALNVGSDCAFINGTDGKVYVKHSFSNQNDNQSALAGDSSYVYGIKANVNVLYCQSDNFFYVDLKILDTDGSTIIIEEKFVINRLVSD